MGNLIDQLRLGQPTVTVLLGLLIPTTSATNNPTYNSFNALLPALAQQKTTAQSQVIIVDQNTDFNAATETTDGVHPNALGEEKMATRWYASLQTLLPTPPTGSFTLTVTTSGSGYVIKNLNQVGYASGTSVSVTASAAAGFQFAGWSGDVTDLSNPLTVSMTANKNITATFTGGGSSVQQVSGYTLVNASTNSDIMPLLSGAQLNLATLPSRNLNIRADTSPATVGSVVLALTGTQTRNQTENVVPYALFSDNNGAYYSWTPAVGSYALTARPYSGGSGSGTVGTALPITFSVIDQLGQLVVAAPLTTANTTITPAQVVAYPNPSASGQFSLVLPEVFVGAVSYRLVSVLGATVVTGTLHVAVGGAVLPLDFTAVMSATGLYYLLLVTPQRNARLKLTRL